MAAIARDETGTGARLRGWRLVGWVLLLVVGAFPVVAAGLDLLADGRLGLPSDHAGAFAAVAGVGWPAAQSGAPGVTRYVTLLEGGYALHELTFALLLVVILAIPLSSTGPEFPQHVLAAVRDIHRWWP